MAPKTSMFLRLGIDKSRIAGGSTHPDYPQWVEIQSFVGEQQAERPTFQNWSFTHRVDPATPLIQTAVAVAAAIPEARFEIARILDDGPVDVVMAIEFEEVSIVSCGLSCEAGSGYPIETFELNFRRIHWTSPDNEGTDVTIGFDLVTNTLL